MNDVIIKLGLESNMLNYVDNETPRYYFLSGNADENDLQKFAELIIKDVIKSVDSYDFKIDPDDLICELKQRYLQR